MAGLAVTALLATLASRGYKSRTERQNEIELDVHELTHDRQQRQIDKLNRDAVQAERAAKIAVRRR